MKFLGKLLSVLAGIVYVIFAFYLFFNPLANLVAMSWLFAFSLCVGALASFFSYLSAPASERRGHLFFSILNVIFAGIFLAYGYWTLPLVLPTVFAVTLLISSISGLFRANRIKVLLPRLGSSMTWLSVLGLVLGVILLFNPMTGSLFVSYLVALGFIYDGIVYLMNALAKFGE